MGKFVSSEHGADDARHFAVRYSVEGREISERELFDTVMHARQVAVEIAAQLRPQGDPRETVAVEVWIESSDDGEWRRHEEGRGSGWFDARNRIDKHGLPPVLSPVPAVTVDVFGRFEKRGHAAVLFRVALGDESWIMKVPDTAKPDTARALPVREFLYWRLAQALGLPVLPVQVVRPCNAARHLIAASTRQRLFTATPCAVLGAGTAWSDIRPADRAALAIWENATTIFEGDRLRAKGPQDVYFHASSAYDCPYVMIDYESMPNLWDVAVAGAPVSEVPVKGSSDALKGVPASKINEAKEAAAAFLDAEWPHATSGILLAADLERVRRAMKKRIEATCPSLVQMATTG